MARSIYLDNAATTPVAGEVAVVVQEAMLGTFGNPSSPHTMGLEAERLVGEAREILARALGSKNHEVYFTSGGTEADNLAIRGVLAAQVRKGRHVVASAVEHAAVLETLRHLARMELCEYTLVPPMEGDSRTGGCSQALRADTVLVSVMLVNNELGLCNPYQR